MGLSGNLQTMLPGDLLQWLSLGQKTGTLVITNKRVEKKIFFRRGRVISSASNDPREYLGQFLMMIEVITEADLQRLMRLKAEEEIYDIFLWNDGDFYFIDDELPQME